MITRALVFLFLALAPLAATAEERITDFDVVIDVERDGDILVTETISVVSEGSSIRRGIYRDLPRRFVKGGATLPYAYDIRAVTRDGAREPYAIEREGNAFRIRVGDADVLLPDGPHRYSLTYAVKNQVRYFEGYDEIYWNATGDSWVFPIERARAVVNLPGGAPSLQRAAYTGRAGEAGRDVDYRFTGGAHYFNATRRFAPGEGMTVAVGFEKGVVDPPSAGDARAEWWTRHRSALILAAAFIVIAVYYFFAFERIGRDPPKGPVFARYEPPAGLSPAAVHHVYHRGLSGHDALIATILDLAVRKRLRIEPDRKRKLTVLERLQGGDETGLGAPEKALEARLLANGEFSFGKTYNSTLTTAYERFRKAIAGAYGAPYFKWNRPFLLIALALSALAVFAAVKLSVGWTAWHTAISAALFLMGVVAAYFLPAPTAKGQETRAEIEGFRLYLKTAEALQLNAVEVGSEAPPPMTVERYERFLPYAIALGVEKPWTEHFEKLMPKEAAEYRPHWTSGNYGGGRSLAGLNRALVAGISSSVASSLPQSSSSTGSGGGGSSGGGGGGGGGGGW